MLHEGTLYVLVKEKMRSIEIKVWLPVYFLHNLVLECIFVKFTNDIPRVFHILGRRPESPVGAINLKWRSDRQHRTHFPAYIVQCRDNIFRGCLLRFL